jgi:hypothetical protein
MSIFDWLGRKPTSEDNPDLVKGHFRVPNFDRLPTHLAGEIRDSIKESLQVGPGHDKGGDCPMGDQFYYLATDLVPLATQFVTTMDDGTAYKIAIICLNDYSVACHYLPPKNRFDTHEICVSHGMAIFSAIIAALFARLTESPDEDRIEIISSDAFKEIALKALDFFWNPQSPGKGLITIPVERMSRFQLRMYVGLLASMYGFLLAHELAHFSLLEGRFNRPTIPDIVNQGLKEALAREAIPVQNVSLPRWKHELEADIVGDCFLQVLKQESGKPPSPLGSIHSGLRMLGTELLLLSLDLLLYHGVKTGHVPTTYSQTHPSPSIRLGIVRIARAHIGTNLNSVVEEWTSYTRRLGLL